MAHTVTDLIQGKRRALRFGERYPDFAEWLDGQTWELDLDTEIHEPLNTFRASLYYQATCFGQRIATKVVKRENGRKVLLVRAYED